MDEPINPLKELRLERHLTLDAVAFRSGISRIAIIRNEQGCFTDPNPALIAFFRVHFALDETDLATLIERYHAFQRAQRQASFAEDVLSKEWLSNCLDVNLNLNYNPITSWRIYSNLSKARVSTAFCIHPAIVSKLELQPHLVPHDLPIQYLTALLEAGYPSVGLDALSARFKAFRSNQRKVSLALPLKETRAS